MGKILKRVPLDFDHPLHKVWKGYFPENASKKVFESFPVKSCEECEEKYGDQDDFCREEETPYCVYYNLKWRDLWFEEVPVGEGYQLWENTSEESPISPVFKTLDELCKYAEENCSTFADFKTTKEEWKRMLEENRVYHKEGNIIYI